MKTALTRSVNSNVNSSDFTMKPFHPQVRIVKA